MFSTPATRPGRKLLFGCLGESIAAIFRQILKRFSHLPWQTSEVTHEASRRKSAGKLAVERFGFRD